jgi:lipopolysaccharide export system permease protein
MTLHWYFARKFLALFSGLTFGFFVIFVLIDLVEQARRYTSDTVGFSEVLGLSLLKSPEGMYILMPLILIMTSLGVFLSLARSSELVVVRAAGRSALVSLTAPTLVTLLIGLLLIGAMNPIVAATTKRFETLSAQYSSGESTAFSLSEDGLWLRQGNPAGQTVIHARAANWDGSELRNVSFLTFARDGGPIRRVEARTARLENGYWFLTDAKAWPLQSGQNPERAANLFPILRVPSSLTRKSLSETLGRPELISFWDLPGHITELERAGFSARRYAVWLHMEMARPVFLTAMVLIGAAFTMRHQRGGRTGVMILMAIVLGFGLYFIRNFAQVLGENGQIPVLLAAWAPPVAGILAALGLILHLEDG